MDEADGATLDAACTWGKRTDGRAGQALATATAARSARPGATRQGLCVWGGVCVGGIPHTHTHWWGEYRRASDMATGGGAPSRSRPRSAAAVWRRQGRSIGEYKARHVETEPAGANLYMSRFVSQAEGPERSGAYARTPPPPRHDPRRRVRTMPVAGRRRTTRQAASAFLLRLCTRRWQRTSRPRDRCTGAFWRPHRHRWPLCQLTRAVYQTAAKSG